VGLPKRQPKSVAAAHGEWQRVRKILIIWHPQDDRELNTSRFAADENDIECLPRDYLIEDAREAINCRIILERIGRTVPGARSSKKSFRLLPSLVAKALGKGSGPGLA
jgi:hypothetical protein